MKALLYFRGERFGVVGPRMLYTILRLEGITRQRLARHMGMSNNRMHAMISNGVPPYEDEVVQLEALFGIAPQAWYSRHGKRYAPRVRTLLGNGDK